MLKIRWYEGKVCGNPENAYFNPDMLKSVLETENEELIVYYINSYIDYVALSWIFDSVRRFVAPNVRELFGFDEYEVGSDAVFVRNRVLVWRSRPSAFVDYILYGARLEEEEALDDGDVDHDYPYCESCFDD